METKIFVTKKVWPFLVSAYGATLMLIAFFIPSIQDQWDRYQARRIIQQYVEIGEDFVKEENYKLALEAFTKAYELSAETRLDIDMKRLNAKVNLIYLDPTWGSKPPDSLAEVDFEFLLHMYKGTKHTRERASTLTSYGIYLASIGEMREAERKIEEAIQVNPKDILAHINLGNLLDQLGKKAEAEKAYLTAVSIDSNNVRAHYNLGLLYSEEGKLKQAEIEFSKAIKLDPGDSDAINQRNLLLEDIEE